MSTYYQGKYISVEEGEQGVKTLILSRAEVRNAFHADMISEMQTILAQLADIADVNEMRLLILRGAGSVFCAGADLSYMKEQSTQSEVQNARDARVLGELFFKVANFPAPVLCCVQGAAIGGGLGLVACSDLVVAEETVQFGTSEVRLGIVPGVISPYVLRKIGVGRAMGPMLSGMRFTAPEAFRYGLIHCVCAQTALGEKIDFYKQQFLQAGPHAARRTKMLIKRCHPLPDRALFEYTAQQIAISRSGEEGQAGLAAFFEKKLPYWC